ncbi:MAG: hypothetical protein LBD15_01930 [Holosporales bacterium]|nr:hypothetical protein [Holosporales bacterium]
MYKFNSLLISAAALASVFACEGMQEEKAWEVLDRPERYPAEIQKEAAETVLKTRGQARELLFLRNSN